jgi:amidophosphoribosyltransferase
MNSTDPFDDDKLREACGVFGIYGHPDAAPHTALGLHALQHRGQEAAGIVTCNGQQFHAHRDLGQVGDIFSSQQVIGRLRGHSAIGHVRYSTTGETALRNVQPLFAELQFGGFALAHNGNLTNALARRRELVERGSLFQSTMDTEVIVHLVATSRAGSVVDRLIGALRQIEGAYSLVGLTDTCVVGVRDPQGVRPLVLGRIDGSHIVASETCALDIMSTSTSRAPIPSSRGRASTRPASASAPNCRAKATCRPTWSSRCPIPACRRPSAMPSAPACPSSWASSATTTSAGPSSNRPSRSATWASS